MQDTQGTWISNIDIRNLLPKGFYLGEPQPSSDYNLYIQGLYKALITTTEGTSSPLQLDELIIYKRKNRYI